MNPALSKLLSNRILWAVVIILGILGFVWWISKKLTLAKAGKPTFNETVLKLFGQGEAPKPNTYTFNGVVPTSYNPTKVTDQIFQAYDAHSWVSPNGKEINSALQVFNALNAEQKVAVLNDWEQRYKGKDRPYWFTGDYGTLKQEIERFAPDLQPEAAIALNWLQENKFD